MRVRGAVIPLSWNPVPPTEACEMSTLAAPVLVSVTVCAWPLPTVRLPKFSLDGLIESCPTPTAVPTPVSATLMDELDALLTTESVAANVPTVFGENVMLMVVLCPASTVTGSTGAFSVKNCVEMAALLTVTDVPPVFVALNVSVLLLPAGTLPKSTVAASSVRTPDCG